MPWTPEPALADQNSNGGALFPPAPEKLGTKQYRADRYSALDPEADEGRGRTDVPRAASHTRTQRKRWPRAENKPQAPR